MLNRITGALARAGFAILDVIGLVEGSSMGLRVVRRAAGADRDGASRAQPPADEPASELDGTSRELLFDDGDVDADLVAVRTTDVGSGPGVERRG